MKIVNAYLISMVGLLVACSDAAPPVQDPADLIFTNARVYTLDWPDPAPDGKLDSSAPWSDEGWSPDADSVAIRDGMIVAVGDVEDVESLKADTTRWIDLKGATLIPGLVDTHTHVFELGQTLARVSLFDVETEAEAVALIVEKAKTVPAGEWIVGQGWDEGEWADRYPDKALLSAAVPNHPVFMSSLHSFAGWGNQMALDRAGITAETEIPVGGEMRLNEAGEPSGLFLNRAVPLLEGAIPAPTEQQLRDNALAGINRMIEDGFVSMHEAGVPSARMDVLRKLEDEAALPARIYAMLSVRDEPLSQRWLQAGPDKDNDSMLVTRSAKAYYDGALGSRGARLLEDYSDRPGHRGLSGANYGFDQRLAARLMEAGFQLGIHAIGDAGNRETLDFIEAVESVSPLAAKGRHRIEHAQVIAPQDMARLAELGVIASMQPPHMAEDKSWAEDRLGPQRILGAYAWRTLRQNSAMLIFGADNPGSDHSIFYGLHSAVARQDKQSEPSEGWYPTEGLNMDEAMRGYTRWPAYAGFRENETGVIAQGRWADLTIMDIDPFVLSETRPAGILDGQILMTVIDGKIAFQR